MMAVWKLIDLADRVVIPRGSIPDSCLISVWYASSTRFELPDVEPNEIDATHRQSR